MCEGKNVKQRNAYDKKKHESMEFICSDVLEIDKLNEMM